MIHLYSFEQRIMFKSYKNYLNKQHKNIKSMSENEENGSQSFLDIKVTSVYCKPTFSGVFTNFESFIPDMHICGSVETLLHRSFRLCSSYKNFHREIETFKSIFKHNNYSQHFMNQCIKKFLNKLFIKKDLTFLVSKRELTFILPY